MARSKCEDLVRGGRTIWRGKMQHMRLDPPRTVRDLAGSSRAVTNIMLTLTIETA